jgi:hypothetical protein
MKTGLLNNNETKSDLLPDTGFFKIFDAILVSVHFYREKILYAPDSWTSFPSS